MQIQNIQDTYYLLNAISGVVILTLGFLLVSIRLPQDLICKKFNKARQYLALSYFILGISGIVTSMMNEKSTEPLELLLITVSVASFQSLLFTATHIVFIQPDAIRKKIVKQHLWGITACILALAFVYMGDLVNDYMLLSTILVLYLSQQFFYINKFHQLHKECVQLMEHFYDEEQEARLRWVNYSFYGALCIGLLSLIASVTGLLMYTLFIILYTAFYTYMVVLVYNNKLITKIIHPAVVQTKLPEYHQEENADHETEDKQMIPEGMSEEDYNHLFKKKLEQWIADKGYLQKDLSVDDIANTLGINRDYLRYYFRTYMHSDFRTWRSELRIKEAKFLMLNYPEYTFTKIALMVGFNHRANFFNQFVKIEGMTPAEWREMKDNEEKVETYNCEVKA